MIAAKVRLVDVLTCKPGSWKGGAGNRLMQKHLDFVLCDPNTTKLVSGIELDDRSHGRTDRQDRDSFLDAAMSAAGVPLIRIPATAQYDASQLAARIFEACGSTAGCTTRKAPQPRYDRRHATRTMMTLFAKLVAPYGTRRTDTQIQADTQKITECPNGRTV